MDLSTFSDEQLALILFRVPAKELITVCTQVSKQWNRVLAQKHFWRDKMEQDGYRLEWRKLVGLSAKSHKTIAVRHSFERNLIKDSWDLSVLDERCLKLDPRWSTNEVCWPQETDTGGRKARIEIPPNFKIGQPEVGTEFGEPIGECLATSFRPFTKGIVFKLADEGLTNEIMDKFRPTIIVFEFVSNRHDCASRYQMKCALQVSQTGPLYFDFSPANDDGLIQEENRFDDAIYAIAKLRFKQWEAERWVKVEHIFKDYPKGMRYLTVQCIGCDSQFWAGYYGVKMANCSVKALCEKNAPE